MDFFSSFPNASSINPVVFWVSLGDLDKTKTTSVPQLPLRACIMFASTLSSVGFCKYPSGFTLRPSMNIYRRVRDWQRIPECLFRQDSPCHSTKASPRIPEGSGQPPLEISPLKPLSLGRGVVDKTPLRYIPHVNQRFRILYNINFYFSR